jgi:hypothetical protein
MDSIGKSRAELESVVARLRSAGMQFDEGMSNKEIVLAEEKYGIRFPPDLREFLQIALPLSQPNSGWFPSWRFAIAGDEESHQKIVASLEWPADGIYFDIERCGFWMEEEWGTRPSEVDQAKNVARQKVEEAPRLIPIFSHRYIPSEPNTPGNPVFSVYQTDIIHYGADVVPNLEAEFLGGALPQDISTVRPIRFWSRLVEVSCDPLYYRPFDTHAR